MTEELLQFIKANRLDLMVFVRNMKVRLPINDDETLAQIVLADDNLREWAITEGAIEDDQIMGATLGKSVVS